MYDYDEIRSLFIAYIAAERRAARRDHSSDCEMQVLDMMLAKADAMDHKRREQDDKSMDGGWAGERDREREREREGERERERERAMAAMYQSHCAPPLIIPPEHMHLAGIAASPRARASGASAAGAMSAMSVQELTLPSHPAQAQAQAQQAQQEQLHAHGPAPLQSPTTNMAPMSMANGANGALTLAPPAEEWLPAGRPWEPRPPYDPSAAAFPAADDMQSWNTLLNFIGTPAEAQPWYESDAVVIEE